MIIKLEAEARDQWKKKDINEFINISINVICFVWRVYSSTSLLPYVFSFQRLNQPRTWIPLNGIAVYVGVNPGFLVSRCVAHPHGRTGHPETGTLRGKSNLKVLWMEILGNQLPDDSTTYSYDIRKAKHTTVISNIRSQDVGELHTRFPNMKHL
jgi:hypothetical protein